MKHRPDIDGLRAVAIVPVVLYHAKVALIAGEIRDSTCGSRRISANLLEMLPD